MRIGKSMRGHSGKKAGSVALRTAWTEVVCAWGRLNHGYLGLGLVGQVPSPRPFAPTSREQSRSPSKGNLHEKSKKGYDST